MMSLLPELGPMDWEQEAQRIRELKALESEIISAIINVPTDQLSLIVSAVESGVNTGDISITPYDWRPAMARLRSLDFAWPGQQCQQCGSPLGGEDSNNNYGPGMCWFCH